MTKRAYFVKYPSRIEHLLKLHLLTDERPFFIVGRVLLPRIDYENFITDMTVERQFLEKWAPLCRGQSGGALPCVLVLQRGRRGGVLVAPDREGFVIWAAYVRDAEGASE